MASRTGAFLKMLERGQDSALLRFSLGNEYLAEGKPADAVEHLRAAIDQDHEYSAAWKLLGRALAESGSVDDAIGAYAQGIEVATAQGDRQAAKEMQVFMKRLQKQQRENNN